MAAKLNPDAKDGSLVACMTGDTLTDGSHTFDVMIYEDHGTDDEPTIIIPCLSDAHAQALLNALRANTNVAVL